jgi:type IV secretory pathway TraG/TraD family ATPase VirD4
MLAAFTTSEKRTAGTGKQEKPLLSESSIMMMKPDQQVVIMQGYSRHPIRGESPRYFKDPEMLAKSKIPAAPAIPEWIRKKNEKFRAPSAKP